MADATAEHGGDASDIDKIIAYENHTADFLALVRTRARANALSKSLSQSLGTVSCVAGAHTHAHTHARGLRVRRCSWCGMVCSRDAP